MTDYCGVMVYSDVSAGKLPRTTMELLGGGRMLADELEEELICLVAGDDIGSASKEAIACGADCVLEVSDPALGDNPVDASMQILEQEIALRLPRIVLMRQIDVDLACRLSFRLDVGLSTDCIGLSIDPNSKALIRVRTTYGGNARAIQTSPRSPQIASVRSKAFSPMKPDDSRTGEVTLLRLHVDPQKFKTTIVKRVRDDSDIKVEDAAVIVCGGRGLGGPGPFNTTLKELADVLGGVVGASRPPADNGWVSKALHIGLTGKIVAPDIYVAVAVSGASQHMAGCSGAKTIIAINKDPEASIFREADYGIVGPYEEVVPAFTEKLRELLDG